MKDKTNMLSRRQALINASGLIGTAVLATTGATALAQTISPPPGQVEPKTDHGSVPNLRFSFDDAYNRVTSAGWAREVTIRELPISKEMSGVNMKLNPGDQTGVREMHWHKQSEWSIMLKGAARITAIDQQGRNFIDDVHEGDLWYFPAGIPHSIQALKEGCEFLLVFDDGSFSENDTFLITDWFAHTPVSVLAKNFGVPESAFKNIPSKEKYIFPVAAPGPIQNDRITNPQGNTPQSFSFHTKQLVAQTAAGGNVKIIDSHVFPAAKNIAATIVEIAPGGLREMHWHPTTDEWQFYIKGEARMTVFASGGKARTFDYKAYDVGYVPNSMGHYIENTGKTTVRYLEIFKSSQFEDVSLSQWMAFTPPELVKAHLNVSDELLKALPKIKPLVMKG